MEIMATKLQNLIKEPHRENSEQLTRKKGKMIERES